MRPHFSRTGAIRNAERAALCYFSTYQDAQGYWWYRAEGKSIAADKALEFASDKDYIAHAGEKDGKPLIVVTITKPELAEHEIPAHFIVEPVTPSLWDTDGRHGSGAVKGGARNVQRSGGQRAKSAVESPVKIVFGICDAAYAKLGVLPERKAMVAEAMAQGVTENTAKAQFYRWRKKNGL